MNATTRTDASGGGAVKVRLGARIVFYVLLTCVIPLLVLGVITLRLSEQQLQQAVVNGQSQRAEALALLVARDLAHLTQVLETQMASFRLETASDDARRAFVIATWRLLPEASLAVLVDPDFIPLVPPVSATERQAERPLIDPAHTNRFLASLRVPESDAPTFGQPVLSAEGAWLPVVVRSPYDEGYLLAVELSLRSLAEEVGKLGGAEREVMLLSSSGDVLARAGQQGLVEPARLQAVLDSGLVSLRYQVGNQAVLAALAPAGVLRVAVAEPARFLTESNRRLLLQCAYVTAVALFAAAVMGGLLTRSMTTPVLQLREAARRIGKGELGLEVRVESNDELGELADAFSEMSRSLARSRTEIEKQKEEIQAFNEQLQERVEQRTAELKQAQSRLVQSEQLAAVADMAAGVAHELNNPLAGILGILQILRSQGEMTANSLLGLAEEQALRCRDILSTLTRFTRPAAEGGGHQKVVALEQIFGDVSVLMASSFQQRGVELHYQGLKGLQVRGDAALLSRSMGQMLAAIRSLSPRGAALKIEGRLNEQQAIELHFVLTDSTGRLDDWQAASLSFWAARKVLEEHGVTVTEPQGSLGGPRRWSLLFPPLGAGPCGVN